MAGARKRAARWAVGAHPVPDVAPAKPDPIDSNGLLRQSRRGSGAKKRLDEKAKDLRAKGPKKLASVKAVENMSEIMVSPEYAARLLETNTSNRNVRDDMVMRYARDMASGRWVKNGETIKICEDGTILDGQHRLYAVLESGVSVPLLIINRLPKDVMSTIDTGVARTMGDVFKIEGVGDSGTIAGAMRWWMWYRTQRKRLTRPGKYTHGELKDMYNAMPEVHDAMHRSRAFSSAARLTGPSLFAFVFSGACLFDTEKAEAWALGVNNGEGLSAGNPAFSLRERLVEVKMRRSVLRQELLAVYIMKSWNAFARGVQLKQYRFLDDEDFPEFYGVKIK